MSLQRLNDLSVHYWQESLRSGQPLPGLTVFAASR